VLIYLIEVFLIWVWVGFATVFFFRQVSIVDISPLHIAKKELKVSKHPVRWTCLKTRQVVRGEGGEDTCLKNCLKRFFFFFFSGSHIRLRINRTKTILLTHLFRSKNENSTDVQSVRLFSGDFFFPTKSVFFFFFFFFEE